MKQKILFLCALAVGTAGCMGPVALGGRGDDYVSVDDDASDTSSGFTFDDHIDQSDGDEAPRNTLYMVGVEYPDGVDWNGDIGGSFEGSRLFLMKDGERIVDIPAGEAVCISTDADTHRCIEGHLYTDFSTDSETVVKMDGEELFRFDGRETIRSMLLKDENVYTLGVPRSGGGWAFRRNGDLIASRSEGDLMGGLYDNEEIVMFSFSDVNSSSGKYYVVKNGMESAISLVDGITDVDDIRMVKTVIRYVGRMGTKKGEWICTGNYHAEQMEDSGSGTLNGDFRLHYDGKDMFLTGSVGDKYGLWREDCLERIVYGGIFGMKLRLNNCFYLSGTSSEGFSEIWYGDSQSVWPAGYDVVYESCMSTNGQSYVIGMVDRSDGDRPALWRDGEITSYDFNGFFTAVDFQ